MYIKINGKNYAPLIVGLTRKAKIQYSDNNGENLDGSMTLDPKGTKIYYEITIDSAYRDQELLQSFWDEIIKPRKEGFLFEAPYNQTTLSFRAYIDDEISQALISAINDTNLWDKITLNINPMNSQYSEVV